MTRPTRQTRPARSTRAQSAASIAARLPQRRAAMRGTLRTVCEPAASKADPYRDTEVDHCKDFMSALFARCVADAGERSPLVYVIDAATARTAQIVLRHAPHARVRIMNNCETTCTELVRALRSINQFRAPDEHVQLCVGHAHDTLSARPAGEPFHVYYDMTGVMLKHANGEAYAVERALAAMQPGGIFALTISARGSLYSEAYANGLSSAAQRIRSTVDTFAARGAALVQRPYSYRRATGRCYMRWMLFRRAAADAVAPAADVESQPLPVLDEVADADDQPDDQPDDAAEQYAVVYVDE